MNRVASARWADRGSATVYTVVIALLCLVAAVVGVAVGEVAAARARVSSAADLAALAAADNRLSGTPCGRAASVAAAGHTSLQSCHQSESDMVIEVEGRLPRMVRVLARAAGQRPPRIRVAARAGPPRCTDSPIEGQMCQSEARAQR